MFLCFGHYQLYLIFSLLSESIQNEADTFYIFKSMTKETLESLLKYWAKEFKRSSFFFLSLSSPSLSLFPFLALLAFGRKWASNLADSPESVLLPGQGAEQAETPSSWWRVRARRVHCQPDIIRVCLSFPSLCTSAPEEEVYRGDGAKSDVVWVLTNTTSLALLSHSPV